MAQKFPPPDYLAAFREKGEFPEEIYDTCLPSYLHPNPIVRWWAWKRVTTAQAMVAGERGALAVDLGCGFGVMFRFLSERFGRVCGVETEPRAARKIVQDFGLDKVEVLHRTGPELPIEAGTADLVVALDILEHVPDLDAEARLLESVLRPGGRLLVSVPTENRLYRLGRWMARFKYERDHHQRSGLDVVERLGQTFREIRRKAILPLFTCSLVVLYERAAEG